MWGENEEETLKNECSAFHRKVHVSELCSSSLEPKQTLPAFGLRSLCLRSMTSIIISRAPPTIEIWLTQLILNVGIATLKKKSASERENQRSTVYIELRFPFRPELCDARGGGVELK